MANDEPLAGRKRDLEEDYFRKQDQELIERLRRAAAEDTARRELGERTGLSDPALLSDLERLGFTLETVALLPLMPVLQVAWAENNVSAAERAMVIQLARSRGIAEGSAADAQLQGWLSHRPSPDVFERATRLISAMLAAGSVETRDLTADDLVRYSESIAAASGGVLGIGKVSAQEREVLEQIQRALKSRA